MPRGRYGSGARGEVGRDKVAGDRNSSGENGERERIKRGKGELWLMWFI